MIADPKKIVVQYDPNEKKKYKVAVLKRPQIVTEIKRPDPAAVLVLHSEEVVELTNEEIRILFHQESGPLIARDLLTLVVAPTAPSSNKTDHGGSEEGKKPEGVQDQADLDGSGEKDAAKKAAASKETEAAKKSAAIAADIASKKAAKAEADAAKKAAAEPAKPADAVEPNAASAVV